MTGILIPNRGFPRPSLWMDASASSTYTLADTNRVTSWRNKVNATHDLTAAADARPVYVSGDSGLNGRPAMQFDGTDDMLAYTGRIFTGTSGTLFFMASFGNVDARLCVLSQSYSSSNLVFSAVRRLEQATYNSRPVGHANDNDAEKTTSATTYSLTHSTGYILGITTTGTNDGQWYANGSSQASSNVDPGWRWFGDITSSTPNRVSIGARISNSEPNGTDFCNGLIAEILAWDGTVLTSTQIDAVENYLARRYGINLT